MSGTLITNVSIFDGTRTAAFPGEVLIEDGRIKSVARNERITAPGVRPSRR